MVKEKVNNNSSIEVKKMKQGMSYSKKEKTIIMNVFKYFCYEYPDKNVTEIIRRTSKATGCSEKSIFSFRKEEQSPQGFKEPSKAKIRKKINTNNRLIKYNEAIREVIKNVIYKFKQENNSPSLNTILKSLNRNANFPKFSLMTLRRLLADMGFYYEKNGNKSILVERLCSKESCVKTTQNQSENDALKCRHITSGKDTTQISAQLNIRYHSEPDSAQKKVALMKINNTQPLAQHHYLTYKSSLISHYGNSHEVNATTASTHSPPHIPMMLTPGMPPYHINSSLQPPIHPNKELFF